MVSLIAIQKIRSTIELPSLPQVCVELQECYRSGSPSAQAIADIVGKDPPLVAKLISIANSAQYGPVVTVNSVEKAVAAVGMREIYNLALRAKLVSQYSKGYITEDTDVTALWRHSILTSQLCSRMSKELLERQILSRGEAEGLSTAGLLHDIGMFAMADQFGDRFLKVGKYTAHDAPQCVKKEQAEFGFSHAEVGAVVGHLFSLPDRLVDAIELHHALHMRIKDKPAIVAVSLADKIAHLASTDDGLSLGAATSLEALGYDKSDARTMLHDARELLDNITV